MKCENFRKKFHDKKIALFSQAVYSKIEGPFSKQKDEAQKNDASSTEVKKKIIGFF